MPEPIHRDGVWWREQPDGTWLRWNADASTWEPQAHPPPPPEAEIPAVPALASWGRRVGAFVLDWLIVAIPAGALQAALMPAVFAAGGHPEGRQVMPGEHVLDLGQVSGGEGLLLIGGAISLAIYLAVPFTYFVILHGGKRGQTIGKRILGIRVCDENTGLPIGYWRALGRLLITWGMWFLLYIPGILDALWPLWDDRNQALHDKVVRSLVVKVNQAPEWRSFSGESKLSQVNR